MNRKQFLLLMLALLVLGGVGIALFWQNLDDYRASGAKIGAKLMPGLKLADVARVDLRDAKNKATLVRKENFWVVQERESYPADFKAISDLIIKLSDLKVVQADTVSESLLPQLEIHSTLEQIGPAHPLKFDALGQLSQSQVLVSTH